MLSNEIRKKLQNIISGTLLEESEDHCTTIRNFLCRSFETGPTVKSKFADRSIIKKKQVKFLQQYAQQHALKLTSLPTGSQYLAKGGEATVYLAKDLKNVIKVNDSV